MSAKSGQSKFLPRSVTLPPEPGGFGCSTQFDWQFFVQKSVDEINGHTLTDMAGLRTRRSATEAKF